MTIRHATAADYLEYIRFVHEDPLAAIQSAPNPAFQKVFNQQVTEFAKEGLSLDLKGQSPYRRIVEDLWRDLRAALPEEIWNGMQLAVGDLDNMSLNAFCSRSEEGHVAIVINNGLMTLLNKLSKYTIAINQPESIQYCSRKLKKKRTVKMLKEIQQEVCEHYRITRKPLGPQIVLKGQAHLFHCKQLHVWEMFVLCHELGHALCGHLNNQHKIVSATLDDGTPQSYDIDSHKQEVEADCVGLLLLKEYLRKSLPSAFPENDDRPLIGPLITLFNHLFQIGATESVTHPHPLGRLCSMAEFVYGKQFAQMLDRSYSDHSLISQLFQSTIVPSMTLEDLFSHA